MHELMQAPGRRPAAEPPDRPLRVSVIALDPLLEAGATSALRGCPDVVVVPDKATAVIVLIVDTVTEQVLDTVADIRPGRPPARGGPGRDQPRAGRGAARHRGRRPGLLRRSEASADRLARTVLAAAGGDCTVPPDMLDGLLGQETGPQASGAYDLLPGSGLTERERSVLELVAEGWDTDEIARELSYSPRTVTSVLHDVTHRFRLRNRAHAVAYALRTGLL